MPVSVRSWTVVLTKILKKGFLISKSAFPLIFIIRSENSSLNIILSATNILFEEAIIYRIFK